MSDMTAIQERDCVIADLIKEYQELTRQHAEAQAEIARMEPNDFYGLVQHWNTMNNG